MNSISAYNIIKKFGSLTALNGVTFDVGKGDLFGITGADGAGKTTLFRILTTLLVPDDGYARIENFDTVKDYREIRQIVGYMPGRFSLYGDLTVEENLAFFASVFGMDVKKNYDLIKDIYIRLEPFKKRKAAKLSGGMKQKLALCCSLIHSPSVLFLDEPTTGVDPVSREELWQMLHRLKYNGITIIVSTPYMDEAAQCDKMTFIKNGNLLKTDTPDNIINSFGSELYAVSAINMHKLLKDIRDYQGIERCYPFGSSQHFTTSMENPLNEYDFKKYLENMGHGSINLNKCKASLEDCYMKLENE